MKSLVLALSLLLAAPIARAAALDASWDRLVGSWSGEGDGAPGAGTGTTSFEMDLDRHVLVRHSTSDYPAVDGRPAAHHEDLLVIAAGTPAHASYWDNEGHVIAYDATWSGDGKTLTLVSDVAAPGPRFRLTYVLASPDEMTVTFEMAAPGQDAFRPYVSGRVKRAGKT